MSDKSSGFDSMFNIILWIAGIFALAPTLQRILSATPSAQAYAAQAYHGVEDTRTLNATSTLQWINLIHDYPFRTWISAYFINDGPNPVVIGLNYPDKGFTMNPRETITVNRTGALDEKIFTVYYKCSPGQTASIRVTGTY